MEYSPTEYGSLILIANDYRYFYSIIQQMQVKKIPDDFIMCSLPFLGLLVDGTEDWLNAMKNKHRDWEEICHENLLFTDKEKQFYEKMRNSIKMWDCTYDEAKHQITEAYRRSENHFSSISNFIVRKLHLYDIYGINIVNNKYCCGNTILMSIYYPDFSYSNIKGEEIRNLSEIAGRYAGTFLSLIEKVGYKLKSHLQFVSKDFGGFKKLSIQKNMDYFVLFSLLCQIQFVLYCIDQYIEEECSTKLRFAYLQYYYTNIILSEANERLGTEFYIDNTFISSKFRNAMAHYKLGVSLKAKDLKIDDCFLGLTQKYFHSDYMTVKTAIINSLYDVSRQLNAFLEIDIK